MTMEESLVARLTGAPDIAAIVNDRVSWFERPGLQADQTLADILPSITLTEVSVNREWTHDGPDGLDESRIQFDCWAAAPSAAETLSRLIMAEMENPLPITISGWVFHSGFLEFRRRNQERLAGGETIWSVQIDFSFYHKEA